MKNPSFPLKPMLLRNPTCTLHYPHKTPSTHHYKDTISQLKITNIHFFFTVQLPSHILTHEKKTQKKNRLYSLETLNLRDIFSIMEPFPPPPAAGDP